MAARASCCVAAHSRCAGDAPGGVSWWSSMSYSFARSARSRRAAVAVALAHALWPLSGSYAAWRSGWKYGLSGPNQWREKVRCHSAVACGR